MKDVAARLVGKQLPAMTEADAIHVPVLPVILDEAMRPGEWVVIEKGQARLPKRSDTGICQEVPSAIIDPFLLQNNAYIRKDVGKLPKGARVFAFMRPGSITSMRHVWTHPDHDYDEAWLTDFAAEFELSPDGLMEAAARYLTTGSCLVTGFDTPDAGYDNYKLKRFWHIYYARTQDPMAKDRDDGFFTCSC